LLKKLSFIFEKDSNGEFNLDFKAIPHWGDASVLEKNWCGTRTRAMKSLLALIVQNPQSGNMSYTNAEIKHADQNDCVLEFVDFWKNGYGTAPKMLIFDLYRHLANELPGFEHCTAETLYRKFIENGANIIIQEKKVDVHLKKKKRIYRFCLNYHGSKK